MRFSRLPVFAPEAETGADPSPAAGGGSQIPPSGGQGGGQASGEKDPSPYRPDGLPDHLYGANERETLDKLWGAYKPAREEIAKFGDLGKLPKEAAGYGFEPSEKVKPYLTDLQNDPVMKMARDVALKAGIRDKQFGPFIGGLLEAMIEGELVSPPVDLAAEKAALVPDDARGLDQAARDNAVDKRVRDNHARIEQWKAQGLAPEAATALSGMLDTAAANRAIEFFAEGMKTPQPSPGGAAGQGITEAGLRERARDPRNVVGHAKFDKAFADETDRMYRAFYGE